MILLLGNGYIGSAFAKEMEQRGIPHRVVSRSEIDYTRFSEADNLIYNARPALVINAAGFIPKPTVNLCEAYKLDAVLGNSIFPATLACACERNQVPLAHISTGCLFQGLGPYSETDTPHLSLDTGCGFYVGTKEIAERAIQKCWDQTYIWRIRLPFDNIYGERNYLSKFLSFTKLYDKRNSLTHRGDFVKNALDLWRLWAPYGIYNMTCAGALWARDIAEKVVRILKVEKTWDYFADGEYEAAVKVPVAWCELDVSKLVATGVKVRTLDEAVTDSLEHWKW